MDRSQLINWFVLGQRGCTPSSFMGQISTFQKGVTSLAPAPENLTPRITKLNARVGSMNERSQPDREQAWLRGLDASFLIRKIRRKQL